jgi:hypothetical protein
MAVAVGQAAPEPRKGRRDRDGMRARASVPSPRSLRKPRAPRPADERQRRFVNGRAA